MRSIFSLAVFMFVAVIMSGQSDAIKQNFTDYLDDDNFTTVYISPKVLKMIKADDDKELSEVINNLRGLRILRTEKDPLNVYKEANKRLESKNYDELINFREQGSTVKFMTKESGGTITELVLLKGGKDEFVVMSFLGKIDLKKISKLADKLDIDGAQYLDKVKK